MFQKKLCDLKKNKNFSTGSNLYSKNRKLKLYNKVLKDIEFQIEKKLK